MPSNPRSIDRFQEAKQLLLAKKAELGHHYSCDGIAIERTSDSMDELVLANERDLIVEALNREAMLLRQISEALERIETGDYGVCLQCGGDISTKRLAALPWAVLCLNCQEVEDSDQRSGHEDHSFLLHDRSNPALVED